MKKKIFLKYIVFALLIILSSCDKQAFDYRNKYIGDYNFSCETASTSMGNTTYSTSTWEGKIEYGDKGKIAIEFKDSQFQEFEISKKGILSVCGNEVGKATKKEIHLKYNANVCGTGPNGSIVIYTIVGLKQ